MLTYDGFRQQCRETGLLEDLERIARANRVSLKAVFDRDRRKSVVRARGLAWKWLYEDTGKSYPEIGALFARDHTTVMAAVRRARDVEEQSAQAIRDTEGCIQG